jgi:hypothetical protein
MDEPRSLKITGRSQIHDRELEYEGAFSFSIVVSPEAAFTLNKAKK